LSEFLETYREEERAERRKEGKELGTI